MHSQQEPTKCLQNDTSIDSTNKGRTIPTRTPCSEIRSSLPWIGGMCDTSKSRFPSQCCGMSFSGYCTGPITHGRGSRDLPLQYTTFTELVPAQMLCLPPKGYLQAADNDWSILAWSLQCPKNIRGRNVRGALGRKLGSRSICLSLSSGVAITDDPRVAYHDLDEYYIAPSSTFTGGTTEGELTKHVPREPTCHNGRPAAPCHKGSLHTAGARTFVHEEGDPWVDQLHWIGDFGGGGLHGARQKRSLHGASLSLEKIPLEKKNNKT